MSSDLLLISGSPNLIRPFTTHIIDPPFVRSINNMKQFSVFFSIYINKTRNALNSDRMSPLIESLQLNIRGMEVIHHAAVTE